MTHYDNLGIVSFTFDGIKTSMVNGKESKKAVGLPLWQTNLTKENYHMFIHTDKVQQGMAVLTGKISGITGIDFDDIDYYNKTVSDYPELKNYYTVKTKKGFHIYASYDERFKQTTNAFGIKGLDIRNDGGILYAPPTVYKLLDGNVAKYDYLGGAIMPLPEKLISEWMNHDKIPENKIIKNDKKENYKEENDKKENVKKEDTTDDEVSTLSCDTKTRPEPEFKEQDFMKIKEMIDDGVLDYRADNYDPWFKTACIFKNEFGPVKGYELFEQFSKRDMSKYNQAENKQIWDKYIKEKPVKAIKMGTLIMDLKIHNPDYNFKKSTTDASAEVHDTEENNFYISVDDVNDPYNASKIISKSLKHVLVFCNEKWFMLSKGNLWRQEKEASYYIINQLRKFIDNSNKNLVYEIANSEGDIKEKLIEKSKQYLKSYKLISASSYLNVITKYLKTLLIDDEFEDKVDANIGKLAFRNGIMDLKTKIFKRGIEYDDFVSETIPYDYTGKASDAKINYVKGVLKKILNNNDEHLEYYLSVIGHTFTGMANLEKSLYFCVDKTTKESGDNGKTFYFDILTHLMPNYVYKSKGSLLEEGNTKVHKQLAMMKGKRLVWIDEYGKKKTNAELIKELGDGLTVENEVMFGTCEKNKVLFKLFALTNHMPMIDPKENAVYNRYKQISYGSHFDRTGTRTVEEPDKLLFIADTSLGDKLKNEYYDAIFELIIEYASKYYERKLPSIPDEFLQDAKETQMSNDPFSLWFHENCVIDDKERVAHKLLYSRFEFTEKHLKEGMARLGFKYNKDLCSIGKDDSGKYYKGGYVGVKLKVEEQETEDEIL
jgi:phage/plasmid-associated DNA primase